MRYRFIRIGHRSVDEIDHDYIIRDGFNACLPDVKARLEAFFSNPKQDEVKFEFEGQTVTVRRESK